MYHPEVISASVHTLEQHYHPRQPLRAYTPAEVEEWKDRLSDVLDSKGRHIRAVTSEEQAFIINEWILTKASYEYWAERYCYITLEGAGFGPMFPLFDSQKLILSELAALEKAAADGDRTAGILIAILKARQLGASTLSESLLAHRATTQNHVYGLIASDVPGAEGSGYFFGMFEQMIGALPWWLAPKVLEHVKDEEILFDGGTHIWVAAGKSTRGTTGNRGQIGRGKTVSILHLSELSTWEDPGQLDGSLFPSIPLNNPRVLGIGESTAKGRNNWWHKHWDKAVAKKSRWHPIFIPWYAEPSKYRLPAPIGWTPATSTVAHAVRCAETGPRWVHRPVVLTRDQLFWYESTRAEFEVDNNLSLFLEEYAADPEEAFQHSGKGLFTSVVLQRVQDQAKPLSGVVEVLPMRELGRVGS